MDQSKSRVGEDSELEGTEMDPCADSVHSRFESHELQDQWSSSKTTVVILLVLKTMESLRSSIHSVEPQLNSLMPGAS